MKVVIAGSRGFCKPPNKDDRKYKRNPSAILDDWEQYEKEYASLCITIDMYESKFGPITEVISGTAVGVDQAGERWASERDIPIERFKPDWVKLGKSAGFVRNVAMLNRADGAIVAVKDGSKGSDHTLREAKRRKMPLLERRITTQA